ncbi:MAG: hypothetical protein IJW77_12935 [Clostridia bacterium]|nr:hypothetical protein [Clostridia bacterium]
MKRISTQVFVLCVLLTVFAYLFCGCNTEDREGTYDTAAVLTDTCGETRRYQTPYGGMLTPIDLGGDSVVSGISAVNVTDDGSFLSHAVGGRYAVTRLSSDGTVQETWIAPEIGVLLHRAALLSDGTWLLLQNGAVDGAAMLYRADGNGTILSEIAFPGQTSHTLTLACFDDQSLVCCAGNRLYLLDYNLRIMHEEHITSAVNLKAVFDADGDIIITAVQPTRNVQDAPRSYYRLNPETLLCEKDDSLLPPEPIDCAADIKLLGDTRYYVDAQGIWNIRGGEAVLLLAWAQASLSANDTAVCAVLADNAFLVRMSDPMTSVTEFAILRCRGNEETAKTEIRLGLLGIPEREGLYRLIDACVTSFNRQSDAYHITLHNYGDLATELEPDAGIRAYERDILGDDAPDITVSFAEHRALIGNLAGKGAYFDLAPYIDGLLPCVTESTSTDGKLYSVPLLMKLYTLAAKAENSTDAWTTAQMYALGDTLADGDILAAVDDRERFFRAVLETFMDREHGTCAFDTPAFARFVTFYENAVDTVSGIAGYFPEERGYVQGDMFVDALRGSSIRFTEVTVDSAASYAALKLIYGEDGFVFTGYPSEDGSSPAWLSSETDLSVCAKSPVLRGAVTFIEYLLSDAVQTADRLTSLAFPVTQTAMEMQLSEIYHFFYDTMIPVDETEKINIGWFAGLSAAEIPDGISPEDMVMPGTVLVTLTETDIDKLRTLLYDTPMLTDADSTLNAILNEELSAYFGGGCTFEKLQTNLQSRISIYLQE